MSATPPRTACARGFFFAVLACVGSVRGADGPGAGLPVGLERAGSAALAGAETLAFEPSSSLLLASCDEGVVAFHLAPDGSLSRRWVATPGALAGPGGHAAGASVTHVAVDPLGRGFGAAAVLPANAAGERGLISLFCTATGEVLRVIEAGYGPDMVVFTPDGAALLCADEGEPGTVDGEWVDPPGSVTVVRTGEIVSKEHLARLDAPAALGVVRVEVGGPALERALAERCSAGLPMVRIHPSRRDEPWLDMEPEYIAVAPDGRRAWVTFQENNAVGLLDIERGEWVRIRGLGSVERRMDASDADGGPNVRSTVRALPMPDQSAFFTAAGGEWIITADEGDDRGFVRPGAPPHADKVRLADAASAGLLARGADLAWMLEDAWAGRLEVCAFSGVPPGGGLIERPTALGARSISILDAGTLERISDSGSALEEAIAQRVPGLFNADPSRPRAGDIRSPRRGPEPEGVAVGLVGGRVLAFVACERPGMIAVFDVSDPRAPLLAGFEAAAAHGYTEPEGILFVAEGASPTGGPLVAAAFEASGHIVVYRVLSEE